jgi:hypothetical protein
MKKLFAIGMIVVFVLHFAGWYAYFGMRLMSIHREMRKQLKELPKEQLELIKLTQFELRQVLRESDEMELDGKMYDIARVEIKEGVCFVYALHDGAEDNLLGFLDEVLSRSSSDKKPVPSQLLTFIKWIYLPVQGHLTFSTGVMDIAITPYFDFYTTIVCTVDSPPPRA